MEATPARLAAAARRQLENGLARERRKVAQAVDELELFVQRSRVSSDAYGWHNLATTVAMGAAAAEAVKAYTEALAVHDFGHDANPTTTKEQ